MPKYAKSRRQWSRLRNDKSFANRVDAAERRPTVKQRPDAKRLAERLHVDTPPWTSARRTFHVQYWSLIMDSRHFSSEAVLEAVCAYWKRDR